MRSSGGLDPADAESLDDLVERLRQLKASVGRSYRQIHTSVVRFRQARGIPELPAMNTVYRCFEPGRSWVDLELVADIARALLGSDEQAVVWRQACQMVLQKSTAASVVDVSTALPSDLPHFTGRRDELRALMKVAAGTGDHGTVVAAIHGMPGVGKTALAVHAGRRLITDGLFDEIQFSVDLRGFDPTRPPAEPGAVLDGILRALGLPGTQIQHLSVDERSAKFRHLLVEREALILLDNAAGIEQVRPLLPVGSRCLVIVTSRRTLAGLPNVHQLSLDVFTPADSMEYLGRSVSDGRVGADPHGARQVTELLGHTPLALAVVAARMRATPDWTISDHWERLADQRVQLRFDDSVEMSLSLSYQQLPEPVRRTFRLVGLHPGQDFDPYATAALIDADLDTARAHLDHLVAGNLLRHRASDHFDFHDLVHTYAAARASDEEAPRARRSAMNRLLGYHARATTAAVDVYEPHDRHRHPRPADGSGPLPDVSTIDKAMAWLDNERVNLLASAEHAAKHGWPSHTIHQSATLWRFLAARGRNHDAEILHSLALEVTDGRARSAELIRFANVQRRLGRYEVALRHHREALTVAREFDDTLQQAETLGGIGRLCWLLGRYDEAIEHHQASLALGTRLGDPLIEMKALNNAGIVFERVGRNREALDHYDQALARALAAGASAGAGAIHGNIGFVLVRLGRLDEALTHYDAALRLARQTGDQEREARTLNNLGVAFERANRLTEAGDHQRQSLEIVRAIGDRAGEAYALTGLGVVIARLGRPTAALDHHRRALAIARQINDKPVAIQVLLNTGDTLSHAGSLDAAIEHFEQALAAAVELGELPAQARAHHGLGLIARTGGRAAHDHLARAYMLYHQLDMSEAADIPVDN